MQEPLKPLYVGTLNDGLFIIDQPPRPAPTDHAGWGTETGTNVIAKMTDSDAGAQMLAKLFAVSPQMLSCVRLYHDAFEIMNDAPDDSDKAMAQDKIAEAHRLAREIVRTLEAKS